MRPDQLIEVIVNGERSGRPSWICCVTGFTGGGQIQRYVAWIGAGCIVIGMTTGAGCRWIGVVTLVTVVAGYGCVRTCERPHGTVIESGGHPCCLAVAVCTGSCKLLRYVIWISRCVVVIYVAACTGCRWIGIVTLVTIVARHGGMRAHNRIEGVIQR